MKILLSSLALLALGVAAHDPQPLRRAQHQAAALRARQPQSPSVSLPTPPAAPAAPPPSSAPPPPQAPPASGTPPPPAKGPPAPAPTSAPAAPPPAAPPAPASGAPPPPPLPPAGTGAPPGAATLTGPSLTATDPAIPPLASLVSNMPSQATPAFAATFSPGAKGPVAGAPPLPSTTLDRSKYPNPTQVAPTDTDLVRQWIKELDGVKIPDIPPTTNLGLCDSNAAAAADTTRCWWTCGGCTRDVDIHVCPNKMDWGVSFDDGPSPYSPRILDYLQKNNIKATFFDVGSSTYWNWNILQAEYMAGHQISVHTWFHQHLTTLSNEQIVAELGYAREIIKDVTGVTPTTMRPPYGDIDDRVRAISLAMGLRPIIWTRNPTTREQFDTNDWQIPAGNANGPSSYVQFQNILQNASNLDTGFIVLQHDLYEQTVDLATGYTLPSALQHQPPFQLKPIHQCLGQDLKEAYKETAANPTMPPLKTNWTGNFLTGLPTPSGGGSSSDGGSGGSNQGSGAGRVEVAAGAVLAALLAAAFFAA